LPEFKRHLQRNRDFLDGVCITGGEPTLYHSVSKLAEQIKDIGLSVKLDTNGTDPSFLGQLIENGLVDYIAMDIKAPLDERYHELAGLKVDLEKIHDSINLIMESSVDYEFRTTVVPKLMEIDNLKDISTSIIGAKKYVLQQFVSKNARDENLHNLELFDKSSMLNFKKQICNNIKKVVLRGFK
jgi:pyruvate formate lyase activating enzyme